MKLAIIHAVASHFGQVNITSCTPKGESASRPAPTIAQVSPTKPTSRTNTATTITLASVTIAMRYAANPVASNGVHACSGISTGGCPCVANTTGNAASPASGPRLKKLHGEKYDSAAAEPGAK